ncbi:hypothetical protein N9D46_00530 [Chitinophagales bacterium]|nr:hypothetical protein [Chitinophagales bacterium]
MALLKKLFWILLAAVLIFLLGISAFLFIQKDFIRNQSIKSLNKQLNTEIDVAGPIDLSFLSNFPNISLSFNDVIIADRLRTNDTLASLGNVRLNLNTWALLNKDVSIDGINARDGFIHLYTDKQGLANYNILKPKESSSASTLLQLKSIVLNNVELIYDDEENNIYTHALSIRSEIAGSFYQKDFDLMIDADLFSYSLFIDDASLFPAKSIEGKLKLKYTGVEGCLAFDENTLNIQQNKFLVSGTICNKTKLIDLVAHAEGSDLREALGLVPNEWLDASNIVGNGAFKLKSSILGKLKNPAIQLDFNITQGVLDLEQQQLQLTDLNLDGLYRKTKDNQQSLHITKFNTKAANSYLNGDLLIANLHDINIEAHLTASLNKQFLNTFLPEDFEVKDGSIELNEMTLLIHHNILDSLWQLGKIEGELSLNQLSGQIHALDLPFNFSGRLTGKESFLSSEEININIGDNHLKFDGEVNNLMEIILNQEKETIVDLGINGNMSSDYFNLNDFIQSSDKDETRTTKPKEIEFPPIFGNIKLELAHVIFKGLDIYDLNIEAIANNTAYTFDIIDSKTLGGHFSGHLLTNVDQNDFEINLSADIQHVAIQELFSSFNNFGLEDWGSENIHGQLNAQLDFSATWLDFTNLDSENFILHSQVKLSDGELISFAPLMSLSGKLELEQLEHLYFTELQADITIEDEWIFVPMTTIQSNLLSLDAGGKHSFDNEIDYKLVLNLKNLLAAKFRKKKTTEKDYVNDAKGGVNLYISMTGTVDDPIMFFDKKGVKDKMKNDFMEEKEKFKNLFKKEEESEFEHVEINFEEIKEEDKYLDWED